jgi:hypothetical protein
MNCKHCRDLAVEIAFGESSRSASFDAHLKACPECRREFEAYRFAAQGIEDAMPAPAPSLSNERLHAAIIARTQPRTSSWLPKLALAGAFATAAYAFWFAVDSPRVDEPQPRVLASKQPPAAAPIEAQPAPTVEPVKTFVEKGPSRVVASVEKPKQRRSAARRHRTPEMNRPEDDDRSMDGLMAAVVGGAEGALAESFSQVGDVDSTRAVPATASSPKEIGTPPIVVIQPEGQATEKKSNDVSIGG